MKVRSEVRRAVKSKLLLLRAIGLDDEDLKLSGHDQFFLEEIFELLHFGICLGTTGAPHDPLTIRRIESAAVVADFIRKSVLIGAINVHLVELDVVIARRCED